jgi:hypothetical protein
MPSEVTPSKNSTLPVAVPDPGAIAATVAVSATLWPKLDGFGALASDVDVLALFTVCVLAADVLPVKLVLPA